MASRADTPEPSGSLPSSFDGDLDFHQEGRFQKFTRKLKEEPLIPFGCLLTSYALYQATLSIRTGDHERTNRMFRFRILAQGFTLLCLVGGSVYYAEDRQKRKMMEGAVAEKKVQEKKEAWIKELEARDAEDKRERERVRLIRETRAARRDGATEGTAQAKARDRAANAVRSVLEGRERRSPVLEALAELRKTR